MKMIDLHCDTMSELAKRGLDFDNEITAVSQNQVAAAGFSAYAQCFALFVEEDDDIAAAIKWNEYERVFHRQLVKYQDRMLLAASYKELVDAVQEGRIAALLTCENASAFGGNLARIEMMKKRGCIMASLTWNGRNSLAGGASAQEYGLSEFGKKAVAEMERCRMLVDISHLSDRATEDFFQIAIRPFVASHSNCRSLCRHPRNLPDEYISEIIQRRGLIGINFFKGFLCSGEDKTAGFSEIGDHIEHLLKLGGSEVIALGSDYDGAEVPSEIGGIGQIEALYTYLTDRIGRALTEKVFFMNADAFFQQNL